MINDILNGLGVIKHRKTAFSERSGSSASSRSTTATADARYTVALPNGQIASNLTQAQNGKIGSNSSSLPFPEWIIEMQKNESAKTTPPEVVMPTVQPPEEKQGSGILVPALIFAVGAIAAIVLVKSKPKRR